MSDPPRDEDGHVVPHDDKVEIPDDALLVRYVTKTQLPLEDDGRRRLSTAVFSETSKAHDPYQGMSVDILDRLERDGIDPRERMKRNDNLVGAVLLRAGDLRALGLQVGPDPMRSNDPDPYHAQVWGVKKSGRKKIARLQLQWLVQPDNTVPFEEG
jgi:hypothetical protein